MTFTVQDDTGSVVGANAYITVAAFKSYHDARDNSYIGKTDPQIESAIIRATDYLDQRFLFVGRKRLGRDQSTEWPRVNAWDRDRYYVNTVPAEVKDACAEYALRALSAELNPDPESHASGLSVASKSESVGPISESYTFAPGSVVRMPSYPAADKKLYAAGLIQTGGTLARG